nr:MAG TPA: hypothetical protein [Inoviridae sp.]
MFRALLLFRLPLLSFSTLLNIFSLHLSYGIILADISAIVNS